MRCAVVTETYPPEINGVALTVASMVADLRRRGHEVELIRPVQAGERPRHDAGELVVAGAPLPRYPTLRFGWPCTRRLMRHWRATRPDVIYVATEGPLGWSALRAAHRLGIATTTGLHTRFDVYMRSYGAPLLEGMALRWMRHVHARADATFVPTEALAIELRGLGFHRVETLPRTVDTARFRPDARDELLRRIWGVDQDGVAVVYFGRLAPEKNLELASSAFQQLASRWSSPDRLRMVWVGDGPSRAGLEAGHPDHVFCGMQTGERLARHIASADLFLFPSTSETFGNVVLEALACGVPTVAFDCGAAREHLANGVHGAAVDDDTAFVNATVRIGLDRTERQRMAAAARSAVDHLHRDVTIDSLEAHFARVAERARQAKGPTEAIA